MNRRRFLEHLGVLLGLSALSGCRSSDSGSASRVKPTSRADGRRPLVLRVADPLVTSWDYQGNEYVQSIDGEAVYAMIVRGLLSFTGAASLGEAWKSVLKGFEPSQRIVLKPNLNNTGIGYEKAIMTSPQVISGVIRSLMEADIGVRPGNVCLYDLTAKPMPVISRIIDTYGIDSVWRRDPETLWDKVALRLAWGEDAPDVDAPIRLRKPVTLKNGDPLTCYLPKVVTGAHHLINLPVLKAHQFIVHSSALKNHFGTVRYSNHQQYPVMLHGENIQSHIVDINAHPIIKERTRLIVADALFGAPLFTRKGIGRIPTQWKTFEGGTTPKSIFFSSDPVAIESVLSDYIIEEQHRAVVEPFADAYLRDAAEQGLGRFERRTADNRYKKIQYKRINVPRSASAVDVTQVSPNQGIGT